MDFIDPKISTYAENYSTKESQLLEELNRKTYSEVLIPRMLSGHLQGRFLSMMSKLKRPKYILEIGTYTGYSALCLAEGLTDNGTLLTIDLNEELEDLVNSFFQKSEYGNKIEFRLGNALDIIPKIENTIDMVFIDADKENYSIYYEMVLPKMTKGGVIIADNVLWSGKVLDEKERTKDKETSALHSFNKFVQNDSRVENVLIPIRDGIMMAIKK